MQHLLYTWDLYSITHRVPLEPEEENQLLIKTRKKRKRKKKVDTASLFEPNEKSLHQHHLHYISTPSQHINTIWDGDWHRHSSKLCFTSSESIRPVTYSTLLEHMNTNANHASSNVNVGMCQTANARSHSVVFRSGSVSYS